MTEPKKKLVLTPIKWSEVREKKSTLNFKNSVAVLLTRDGDAIPYEYFTLSYSPSLSVKTVDFSAVIPNSDDVLAIHSGMSVLLCKAHVESIEERYINVPLTIQEYNKLYEDATIELDWEVDNKYASPENVEIVGTCGNSLCLLITSRESEEDEDDSDYTNPIQYAAYLSYGGKIVGKTPYTGLKVFIRVLEPSCRKSPFLSSEKVCEVYRTQSMPIGVV